MVFDRVGAQVRGWLVGLFVQAIRNVSNEGDRADIVMWLMTAREIVGKDAPMSEKVPALYSTMSARRTAGFFMNSVTETVRNYRSADLPLSVKLAIPATLLAAPLMGGQGAGVAALGSAIGVPVLLIVFLGVAGLTAIIEALIGSKDARTHIELVVALIVRDEALRRSSAALKKAMQAEPSDPHQFDMPEDAAEIEGRLLAMDPFDFERHVMAFFERAGFQAWVTKKSNDFGVDGFAKREDGVVVVQCKRYALDNRVGRPAVQQFKGVVEENGAVAGYIVTTSGFTDEASQSAAMADKIRLVDGCEIIRWHSEPPSFD